MGNNKQQLLIETQFEGLTICVRPDETHEWLMETKLVAEGYGVSEENIRQHKNKQRDELIENKHFISVSNTNANPRAGIAHVQIFWTKKGIVRLGFFIKSARAKLFRDWSEDLIVKELDKRNQPDRIDQLEAKMHQYLDGMYQLVRKSILKLENDNAQTKELIHNLASRVDKLERSMYQPSLSEQRKSYIYLIWKVGTDEYKIGKSIHPNRRTKELSGGGSELELIASVIFPSESIALEWEDILKKTFKKQQIKGEWFLLSKSEVDNILQLFKSLENLS
jgi:hypothetical protein